MIASIMLPRRLRLLRAWPALLLFAWISLPNGSTLASTPTHRGTTHDTSAGTRTATRKHPIASSHAATRSKRSTHAAVRRDRASPPGSKTASLPRPLRAHPTDERPLIVIDAGHGGKDSGAVGRAGTREKDITLAEAKELQRLLLATKRYRVVLTRNDDRYVPLSARLAAATRDTVGVFVSLHADASLDPNARGASVYIRSSVDISRGLFGAASTLLQARVIDSLDDDIRMTGAPARAGHLYVLASPDTPSVLVEMGFLSNRHDELLLTSGKHRLVIAGAIRDALDDYFAALRPAAAKRT